MDSELERLRKKVENYPSPSAYTRLAEMLRDSGDTAGAEHAAQRCIKEFPRNGQAYVLLADLRERGGQAAQAEDLLRQALKNDPRCVAAYVALGQRAQSNGDIATAAKMLGAASELRPRDGALLGRAQALKQQVMAAAPLPSNAATAPPPQASTVAVSKTSSDDSTVDLTALTESITSAPAAAPRPTQAAAPAAVAPEPSNPIAGIVAQAGVTAAVVIDDQGRTVLAEGFEPGRDEVFGALAADITTVASGTLSAAGGQSLRTWTVVTGVGQIVAFRRDGGMTIVALAERNVKVAMLELQARQALIDLEGA